MEGLQGRKNSLRERRRECKKREKEGVREKITARHLSTIIHLRQLAEDIVSFSISNGRYPINYRQKSLGAFDSRASQTVFPILFYYFKNKLRRCTTAVGAKKKEKVFFLKKRKKVRPPQLLLTSTQDLTILFLTQGQLRPFPFPMLPSQPLLLRHRL